MTNEQIIQKSAVHAGIFTEAEAAAIISSGRRLPLHTYSEWKRMGYQVKQGEHAALTVMLWKYRSEKVELDNGEEAEAGDCYRTTAHLFTASQVERAVTHQIKTREEIMAYNRMLAEQRKARQSA